MKQPLQARGKGDLDRNLEKYLELARRRRKCDALLILLDADDDCPRDIAVRLANVAEGRNLPFPQAVVCANPHYEVWVVASLSGEHDDKSRRLMCIEPDVREPDDVERLANPKAWLQSSICRRVAKQGNVSPAEVDALH